MNPDKLAAVNRTEEGFHELAEALLIRASVSEQESSDSAHHLALQEIVVRLTRFRMSEKEALELGLLLQSPGNWEIVELAAILKSRFSKTMQTGVGPLE